MKLLGVVRSVGRSALVCVMTWLALASVCLAQDEHAFGNPTPQEQRRAATQMLLVMLAGLIVVVLLLRWVGKRQQRRETDKPDETPFDKAQRFFEDQDKGNDH